MQTQTLDVTFEQEQRAAKPDFKVFFATQNQSTLRHARMIRDQVDVICCEEMKVSHVFWSFALLQNEELRNHAAREAGSAELIVVCMGPGGDLPNYVREWVLRLPVRPRKGEAALVALLEANHDSGLSPDIHWLRRAAELRRRDFICNQMAVGRPVAVSQKSKSARAATEAGAPFAGPFALNGLGRVSRWN